jgi:hypothetical protein
MKKVTINGREQEVPQDENFHITNDSIYLHRRGISRIARYIAWQTDQRIEFVEAALWKWFESVMAVSYVNSIETALSHHKSILPDVYRAELARIKAEHGIYGPDLGSDPEYDPDPEANDSANTPDGIDEEDIPSIRQSGPPIEYDEDEDIPF